MIRETAEREYAAYIDDAVSRALFGHVGEWVVESLLQGAWMREYHEWEKATKVYFDVHHSRNGGSKINWRAKIAKVPNPSHVDRVKEQLSLFSASVPSEVLDAIDATRAKVNAAKHSDEFFVTEEEYRFFVKNVLTFWERLDEQEEFVSLRGEQQPAHLRCCTPQEQYSPSQTWFLRQPTWRGHRGTDVGKGSNPVVRTGRGYATDRRGY